MKLKVDFREKKLIKILESLKLNEEFSSIDITIENLILGDIEILDDENKIKLIIERKTLNDLAASIKDGRYKEQGYRLNKCSVHNHNILYLIEGNLSIWKGLGGKMHSSTLYSAMFSIQYFKGFSVIKTDSVLESAEYILRMVNKLRKSKNCSYYELNEIDKKEKENYNEVLTNVKKNNITKENISEIMLSQIPGVSTKTSNAIMKNFNSLAELLEKMKKDKDCLKEIKYLTKDGKERRINKTAKKNIYDFLIN
jgi:ERCC4-type nuclease